MHKAHSSGRAQVERIERGSCTVNFEVDDEGFVRGEVGGAMLPGNAGPLAAALLRAGADHRSPGVLVSLRQALVALPRIDAKHYSHVPPSLRSVPVAVVVTPDQLWTYEEVAMAAAASGALRRAFLSMEQAQAWLREQARALQASRLWRPAPHPPSPAVGVLERLRR